MVDTASNRSASPGAAPLPTASPESLGLDPDRLADRGRFVQAGVGRGDYPGAQVAVARHGRLALFESFGRARIGDDALAATDDTLWLMFSQTKPVTTAVIWQLV